MQGGLPFVDAIKLGFLVASVLVDLGLVEHYILSVPEARNHNLQIFVGEIYTTHILQCIRRC